MAGWNKPSGPQKPAPKKPSALRGLVAGLVVVALAALAAYFLFSGKDAPKAERDDAKKSRIKEVEPAPAKPRELTPEEKEQLEHPGMVKSSMGVWQPTNRPYRANSTKVHSVYTNRTYRKRLEAPYRNGTEQVLLSLFSCRLGMAPRPIPRLPKKEMDNLIGILISENPVKEGDSPALAVGKEILAEAKLELKKYVKEGGDPYDFFNGYHKQLQQAYEKRMMSMKEVRRILNEEGDKELARQFQDKVNEGFKKEGIMPISIDLSDDEDETPAPSKGETK